MKFFLTAATVVLLAGCVSIPTAQNFGSGRFLQMNLRGATYMQFDTASPESCTAQAASLVLKNGVEIVCSTVSQENFFPYSFDMQNVITSEITTARSKTLEGCRLLKMGSEKDSSASAYKFGECK